MKSTKIIGLILFVVSMLIGATYVTNTASGQENASRVAYQGIVLPFQQVTIVAPIDGLVKWTIEEGSFINQNEVLIQFNDEQQRITVESAKFVAESDAEIRRTKYALDEADILMKQSEYLLEKAAASEWEVRQLRVQRHQRQAEYDTAVEQQQLNRMRYDIEKDEHKKYSIKAPFAGTVTRKISEPGSWIEKNKEVMVFVNTQKLKAEFSLPAEHYHIFKVNKDYDLHASVPINTTIAGKLIFKSPVIDPASQTFRCTFEIDNQKTHYPAGFNCYISLPNK